MFSGLKLFALAARDTVPGTDRVRGVLFFEAGGGLFFEIYFACLFVVCLYPINIKTFELIAPKFC